MNLYHKAFLHRKVTCRYVYMIVFIFCLYVIIL